MGVVIMNKKLTPDSFWSMLLLSGKVTKTPIIPEATATADGESSGDGVAPSSTSADTNSGSGEGSGAAGGLGGSKKLSMKEKTIATITLESVKFKCLDLAKGTIDETCLDAIGEQMDLVSGNNGRLTKPQVSRLFKTIYTFKIQYMINPHIKNPNNFIPHQKKYIYIYKLKVDFLLESSLWRRNFRGARGAQ
jgi:hypothetical protein